MANKLLSVRNDTNRRFDDVQVMLDILDKNKGVDCQLVLKSSLMLMIYNVVEGTMSNLLTEFFDVIVKKKMSIEKLPNKLQNTIYTYYLKEIGNDSKKLKEFSEYDGKEKCNISYLEINRYLKLFSGNLDSRSIRKISQRLGVKLSETIDEPVLLTVKNCRNKLAHGETKFYNTCQDMTLDEAKKMCNKVKLYLEKLINEYEIFLDRL